MYYWPIIIVALLLPIDLSATYTNVGGYMLDIGLCYGWGIFSYFRGRSTGESGVRAKFLGINVYVRRSLTDAEVERGDAVKGILDVYNKKEFIARILKAGRDIYRISPEAGFSATLKVGLDDPAYTGMLSGLIASIYDLLGDWLSFEPDFSGPAFDVTARFNGRLIPVMVAAVLFKHGILYIYDGISVMINQGGGRIHGYKRKPEGHIR